MRFMRFKTTLVSLIVLATPPLAAQQIITPGDPALRSDRIRPFVDTLVVLITPRDSAQRVYSTLVRRIARVREGGETIFRETQRYDQAGQPAEYDTLDASATTLAPVRIVESNVKMKAGHALRFADGRMQGTVWSADSGTRAIDDTVIHPFFHGMMTESFIAGLPLGEGSIIRAPVAETPDAKVKLLEFRVAGTTTLQTAHGPVDCFVVRASNSAVSWVSKADGHLVRLSWTLPNGTRIWKLPRRDVPFVNPADAAFSASSAALQPGAHS